MANVQEKGVHVLTKQIGETPLECMERFRAEHPELAGVAMTYAGRLDPMAEGLLLVLSGEAVHDKKKWMGLPKTYTVKVLWGIETDTGDVLGLMTQKSDTVPEILDIKNEMRKMVGNFSQKYPVYSSQTVNGKPLFQYARKGELGEIEIPTHDVELFEAKHIFREMMAPADLYSEVFSNIDLVTGDFRQSDIKQKWGGVLMENKEYTIDTIELSVSGSFYVRQFVVDLAEQLGSKALAYHILRTKIGDFHI